VSEHSTNCEKARDEILAARCDSRDLDEDTFLHVESCPTCKAEMAVIADFSPEALLFLVIMRGVSR